jgi:hypothetical protein
MSGDNGSRLAFPYFGDAGVHEGGLTKREYFAAMAMQGILSGPGEDWGGEDMGPEGSAEWAVKYADATLAELERTNER